MAVCDNTEHRYVQIPRKNGKSNLSAAIALATLFVDKEPGAEIYCCASSRDQAKIVFDVAKQMIRNSAILSRECNVFQNSIVKKGTNSFLKAVAAEAGTLHGANASCVIYDELHTAKNRELWDVMATSMGARSQPLMIAITTAGVFDPNSICYELYDYGKKVREGIVQDTTFLPLIYEADPEDDIHDEATWQKANPNFGISIKPEYFRKDGERSQIVAVGGNRIPTIAFEPMGEFFVGLDCRRRMDAVCRNH